MSNALKMFALFAGASASVPEQGLFGSGLTTVSIANTDKYVFGTDAVAAGTSLTTGTYALSMVGTVDVGYAIAGGTYDGVTVTAQSRTEKYTYAGDSVAAGTSLSAARIYSHAGAGNTTVGIIAGGRTPTDTSAISATTVKYTYAGDSVAAGTSLGSARIYLSGAGNTTTGIFAGGNTNGGAGRVATTDKYTYSDDTRVAGTVLGAGRDDLTGCGNATLGIFSGGVSGASNPTAVVEKYTYSGDSVAAGTSLSNARRIAGSASNSTVGVIGAGYNGSTWIAGTNKYTYSGDGMAAGTNLTTARYYTAGISNSHGGL